MRAQLIPVKGGKPIEVTRDITVVGRQQDVCDLVIDRTSISKLHCLIVKTDGLLLIRDLGSTNGTKVNGQKVLRGALLPGDELAFAGEKFRVDLGPDSDPDDSPNEAKTEFFDLQEGGLDALLEAQSPSKKPAAKKPNPQSRPPKESLSDVQPLDDGDLDDLFKLQPLDE